MFSGVIDANVGTVRTLRASDAPLGGQWSCTAHGDANDIVAFATASTVNAQTLLGLPLLLDAGAAVLVDFGVIGASGDLAFLPIPVPNQSSLLGVALQASAVTLLPSGGLAVSNPASGVLH